jgi:glycerol-3-phosphate acyltransferase PlsX
VVKSHGSADKLAFLTAIERAAEEARSGMLHHISEHVEKWHHARQQELKEVS